MEYSLRPRKDDEELFYVLTCLLHSHIIPVQKTSLSTSPLPDQYRIPQPTLPAIFAAKCPKCGDVRTCVTERDLKTNVLRPDWFPAGTVVAEVQAVPQEE